MLTSYIELGFSHILDSKGYDHILFVVVLCVAYRPSEWKKMLVLVTAFTVGHTVTLGLAALQMIHIDSKLVEMLIPITIILSAVLNIWEQSKGRQLNSTLHYSIALAFGLIHGLGFSNFFKALVSPEESIVPMLFSFNIGVELGQIMIVLCSFVVVYILTNILEILSHKAVSIAISLAAAAVAMMLLVGVL